MPDVPAAPVPSTPDLANPDDTALVLRGVAESLADTIREVRGWKTLTAADLLDRAQTMRLPVYADRHRALVAMLRLLPLDVLASVVRMRIDDPERKGMGRLSVSEIELQSVMFEEGSIQCPDCECCTAIPVKSPDGAPRIYQCDGCGAVMQWNIITAGFKTH